MSRNVSIGPVKGMTLHQRGKYIYVTTGCSALEGAEQLKRYGIPESETDKDDEENQSGN